MWHFFLIVFEFYFEFLLVDLVLLFVVIIYVDGLLEGKWISEEIFSQVQLHYLEEGEGGVRLDFGLWLRDFLLLFRLLHLFLGTVDWWHLFPLLGRRDRTGNAFGTQLLDAFLLGHRGLSLPLLLPHWDRGDFSLRFISYEEVGNIRPGTIDWVVEGHFMHVFLKRFLACPAPGEPFVCLRHL